MSASGSLDPLPSSMTCAVQLSPTETVWLGPAYQGCDSSTDRAHAEVGKYLKEIQPNLSGKPRFRFQLIDSPVDDEFQPIPKHFKAFAVFSQGC